MSRVLIVNMPFSNLRWPNIGPSLLKAAPLRRGMACDIAYLNFDFAEQVGWDDYYWLSDHFGFVLGGERLFSKHYFEQPVSSDEAYYREVLLRSDADFSPEEWGEYTRLDRFIGPYLEHCRTAVNWRQYDIVGFASSFQQTMPSMCLAKWLKQTQPETKIVFGGAACEGQMGQEMLRLFPEIDYVFLGEADITFADLVEQLRAGGPVQVPPGVAARPASNGHAAPGENLLQPDDAPPPPIKMDDLPYPDFDDFFQRLRCSPLAGTFEPLLFFEASRGCWWGQKHHCVFCGLNGSRMAYRSKSPQRAFDELRHLTSRYQVYKASTSDNILDHRYLTTLLPMLRDSDVDLSFIFEMKTNLTREQVTELLDCGLGGAQLGIETFSTPILKLMDKGATAVQNIQALKWFTEAGIEVKWNFLYGFPGEDPAEYRLLAELLPLLYHLEPPMGAGRVRVDRFAPYFNRPADYGVAHVRPMLGFEHIYPFPAESLARLAYYFDYDYADGRKLADYVGPLQQAIAQWEQLQGTVTLRYLDRSDGVLVLTDTRPCAAAFQQRMTGLERKLYLYCDSGRSWRSIVEFAEHETAGSPADEPALRKLLDEWIGHRLLVHLDERDLALATRGE